MLFMLVRIYGYLALFPEVTFFSKLDLKFPNWIQISLFLSKFGPIFFKKSIFQIFSEFSKKSIFASFKHFYMIFGAK